MAVLEKIQRLALGVGVVGVFLGLSTATGCGVFPQGDPGWAGLLHLGLLVLGLSSGVMGMVRIRHIDRIRWETVQDGNLTSLEREWAHKEAERARQWAGTVFLACPAILGYWCAYQFRAEPASLATELLVVTPIVGGLLGFGATYLIGRRSKPPPSEG